ncbi:unnamed protein product [Closterium sp. NIES-65]|nr:unnamed protein product [Closterium sp. NIES-65]CAI5994381.1 unnamed protein product [Closterium sp. NIES-65]
MLPPPLVSPFSGAAADSSAAIPPPLVSPLIGVGADYSSIIPPLVSPLIGLAVDYTTIIPPLVSPLINTAANFSAIIPPLLVSPLIGSAATTPSSSLLLFLPSAAQQQTTLPLFSHLLCLSPQLLCSCVLLLMATSLTLPSLPLLVLQLAPDDTIAEAERIAATAQATAAAAPDNAAARDLARVLAEFLESTRKRLTEHLAAKIT